MLLTKIEVLNLSTVQMTSFTKLLSESDLAAQIITLIEVLTLWLDLLSRAHVSARTEKRSRDRALGRAQIGNILRARSKNTNFSAVNRSQNKFFFKISKHFLTFSTQTAK